MTVVLDIQSVFEDAQAHVMLSRVQQLKQIYILKTFDDSKIRTSGIALREMERLASISMNENPTSWQQNGNQDTIKVVSLNCAGLKPHYEDIRSDETIKQGDIIYLVETSLEKDEESPLKLLGYESHVISVGNGKGIATYYKTGMFIHKQDYITPNMQITKFWSNNINVINVYRSSKGNSVELLEKIVEMLTPNMSTLITGDFNICYSRNPRNRMSKGIENNGFKQLVKEPTHILGGHIDHVYWKTSDKNWDDPIIERYSAYYSDHDALCITLQKQVPTPNQNSN